MGALEIEQTSRSAASLGEWPSDAHADGARGQNGANRTPTAGSRSSDVRDLLKRVEAASDRMFEYYARNRHLEDEVYSLRQEGLHLNARLEETEARASQLEDELTQANTEINKVRALLASAYAHIEESERDMKVAQENFEILQLAIERAFVDPASVKHAIEVGSADDALLGAHKGHS